MIRSIMLIAALSLSACSVTSTPPPSSGGVVAVPDTPPVPTSAPFDEQAIVFGFKALATVAAGTDALIAVGKIKPGSPTAVRLADGLQTTLAALNGASALQKAATRAIAVATALQTQIRSDPSQRPNAAAAAARAWKAVDDASAAWDQAKLGIDRLRVAIDGSL